MWILKITNFLFEILFPQYCIGCHKKGLLLCKNCLNKADLSKSQLENPHIFSIYNYHDPLIKKALWKLKYKNKKEIAKIFGEILYDYFLEDFSELKSFSPGKPIVIIPIPLSKKRMKKRGYNQSQLISKSLVKNSPDKLFKIENNLIKKIKDTDPQAKITNKQKRLQNIKDAFAISEAPDCLKTIRGRTFIIIDDISTTGGTINEVRKLLKKTGAKKILGFTVAH